MFFFDTVQTFSTTGKSAKGQALQEMAMRFKDVLVQGDYAPDKIVIAMREQAAEIDKQFTRGRKTYINHTIDRSGDSGQIMAVPVTDVVDFDKQAYFRIYYHKVARTATISEAVAIVKGGAK